MTSVPVKRLPLPLWESCSFGEKLILLTGLRYAAGLSMLLVIGYAFFEKWRLEREISRAAPFKLTWVISPIQGEKFLVLIPIFLITYNTLAALLSKKIRVLPLAIGLSALDLVSAIAGTSLTLPSAFVSTFSAIFSTMVLSNILFLGLPTLAVLFGKGASLFSVVLFFLAQAFLYLFKPESSAQIPVMVAFVPMAFFTILIYVIGYISEVEQSYEQKSEALVTELEKANDLKRQFLAFASHELRTPLHAMKGYTSFLLEGKDGALAPQQAQDIEKIASNSDYLLSLINDFLDLTRIEAGRMELDIQEVFPEECIREAADLIASLCKEKNLFLKIELPSALPAVSGDYARLKQVFLNLLGNAVKFTEQGGIILSASSSEGKVRVQVSDTGKGIAPESLSKIFDAYRQESASAGRRYGGSGLGLAIARRLVEMHAGRIGVESKLGSGSLFWVELPVKASRPA